MDTTDAERFLSNETCDERGGHSGHHGCQKKFVIGVDASDYVVRALLEQYDSRNELRPVALYLRKL